VSKGRRIAVFMKGSEAASSQLPLGIIPSREAFVENWDDDMKSGDLDLSAAWLVRDLKEVAVRRDRFYVMQANPNDSETNMYARLNSGAGPASLQPWLAPFLEGLPDLIQRAVAQEPAIRINAVSTDFLCVSKPLQIALFLMGLPSDVEQGDPKYRYVVAALVLSLVLLLFSLFVRRCRRARGGANRQMSLRLAHASTSTATTV